MEAILKKDLGFEGNYPVGVYSFEGLRLASHEQSILLKVMIQAYIGAIENRKLPQEHKKVAAMWEKQYRINELRKQDELHKVELGTAKERMDMLVKELKEYANHHNFDYLGDIPRKHKSAFLNEFADRHPQTPKAGESKEKRRGAYMKTLKKDWENLQNENPPRIGKGFTTNPLSGKK